MIHAVFIIYNGICLFSRQYGKKYMEDILFPSLLMAISQFAKEISKQNLKKIIIGDDIFSFSSIENLLFVYKHDEIKEFSLKKISNEFSTKFLELFKSELKNWNGKVSCFNKFEKEADKLLTMKGQSTLIGNEKSLQEKKIGISMKKKRETINGQLTLIEIEKILRKKKIGRLMKKEKMPIRGQLTLIEIEKFLQEKKI